MAIVGLNVTEIDVKRHDVAAVQVNINNNIAIKNLETKDLSLGLSSQKGLKFLFEFVSKYEPNVGHIILRGNVLFMDDEKRVQQIFEHWNKGKHIEGSVVGPILNAALRRSNIEAIKLSQDVGLPPPIPLPKLTPQVQKKKTSKKSTKK